MTLPKSNSKARYLRSLPFPELTFIPASERPRSLLDQGRPEALAESGAGTNRISYVHDASFTDACFRSAVVGHELRPDRDVGIVGIVGDDHVELEFAARLGVYPLRSGEDHREYVRERALAEIDLPDRRHHLEFAESLRD